MGPYLFQQLLTAEGLRRSYNDSGYDISFDNFLIENHWKIDFIENLENIAISGSSCIT